MSSSEIVIKVSNLSKSYQIYETPRDRLKQFFMPKIRQIAGKTHKQYYREFWALKDVSFEVKKGETVGIIGRNGSGKSTLLQMICGTLTPTSGSIETKGRIAALLELGSGFNPEFTGRENVYMNAAVLGLNQEEVDVRFNDIADFADIGQFIEQPVKTYSSGMVVRLAFAVQSQINPDILVVDEALSVGDAKFQAKCFDRLRQLKENGTCILLVTHSTEQIVTHCTSAIMFNDGVQVVTGEPKLVVNQYLDLLFGKDGKQELEKFPKIRKTTVKFDISLLEDVFHTRIGYNRHEYRWGDGQATILDYYLAADDVSFPAAISSGQQVRLVVTVKFNKEFYRPIFGITLKTKEGVTIYGVNTETIECKDLQKLVQRGSVIQVEVEFTCQLASGDYFVSLGVATKSGEEIIPHDRRYDSIHIHVIPNSKFFGLVNLNFNMNARVVE